MAIIAPIMAPAQPAPQSAANAGHTAESDSSFGAILGQTAAARQTESPHATTGNSNLQNGSANHDNTSETLADNPGESPAADGPDKTVSDGDILLESTEQSIAPPPSTDGDIEHMLLDIPGFATGVATENIHIAFSLQSPAIAVSSARLSRAAAPNTAPAAVTANSAAAAATPNITTLAVKPDSRQSSIVGASTLPGPGTTQNVAGNIFAQPNVTPATADAWPATCNNLFSDEIDLQPWGIPGSRNASIPGNQKSEPIISATLQELITANETGRITVSREPAAVITLENLNNLTQSLQTSAAADTPAALSQSVYTAGETAPLMATVNKLTSLNGSVSEAPEKSNTTKLAPLRQDVSGQFLEARMEARNKGSNNQNQQSGQQEMPGSSQPPAGQSPLPPSLDQAGTFSQVSQGVLHQPPAQNPQISTQPVTSPPGAPVYEESILNQVAERFQLHTRNQETRLNIKLHPVELGELKIDLTMKEGSIRAHVVAQSGQVQEILERNMVRLREMLEVQGVKVEEILVSTKSEDLGSFDLLQDQHSSRSTHSRDDSQKLEASFNDTFESIVTATDTPVTGVNITA